MDAELWKLAVHGKVLEQKKRKLCHWRRLVVYELLSHNDSSLEYIKLEDGDFGLPRYYNFIIW